MLYVSPISEEIVEMAHALAARHRIGFCASVNQVGPGAYTGFEYEHFKTVQALMERKFGTHVTLERDHLGRKGENMREWVERDLHYGFEETMLHVHTATAECMNVLWEFHGKMRFQVGPGEDDSRPIDPMLWAHTSKLATTHSFPNGCLIKGLGNSNVFDVIGTLKHRNLWPEHLIRGHNCDYLTDIKPVRDVCDAFNVAPEIGYVQSCVYHKMFEDDVWEDACRNDTARLTQWGLKPDEWLGIGHYHFDKLASRERAREAVCRALYNFMKGLLE